MKIRNFLMLATCAAFSALAAPAFSGTFDNGLPAPWRCTGKCGTLGADGVVGLAPGGGSAYGWISSYNSTSEVALPGVGGLGNATNGSILRSVSFMADANAALDFRFDYVTTDGAGYADYAWARLLDADDKQVALLFTARTRQAVLGNTKSGVDVATTMRSTSEASTPASASARREASVASWLVVTPRSARWRCRMPVRSTIHSSDVAISRVASSAASSSFETTRSGKKLPVPAITEYFIAVSIKRCPQPRLATTPKGHRLIERAW